MTIPPPASPVTPPKSKRPMILGISAVVIVICAVGGFRLWQHHQEEKARKAADNNAINAVLSQLEDIRVRRSPQMSDKLGEMNAWKWAVDQMHSIDTSRCPTDFRVAVERYLNVEDAWVRARLDFKLGDDTKMDRLQDEKDRAYDEVLNSASAHRWKE